MSDEKEDQVKGDQPDLTHGDEGDLEASVAEMIKRREAKRKQATKEVSDD